MKFYLLNLLQEEIINLIWKYVKPSVKYNTNKYYLNKFYYIRFAYINNKNFIHNIYLTNMNYNKFIISNYNYFKYLIIKNNIMFIKLIIDTRLNQNKDKNYILEKKIYFENIKFINILDFILYYSKKFKINNVYNYILELVNKYNLKI